MSDDETSSKDRFFEQLAQISNAMVATHGKEFAMGALVLAARFIAEGEARARAASEAAGSTAASSGMTL
ncbi:hypothetical protein [Piscinibacter sp.]|uniref:hypothetical protein n=1 Tax=Piscinibacter sp. TaxID=1903157 RepID=UPI002BD0E820|nr:hypothetical protein [Albitalea sp.]HUG22875.1 hypothetical protein [Albitalea sp.]